LCHFADVVVDTDNKIVIYFGRISCELSESKAELLSV